MNKIIVDLLIVAFFLFFAHGRLYTLPKSDVAKLQYKSIWNKKTLNVNILLVFSLFFDINVVVLQIFVYA